MSSAARDEFIRATYDLSKVDPAKWATFVEAWRAYTISELEKITTSNAENAPIAVGFGRKMKELRDDFIQIETIMGKLKQ